MHYVIGDVHGCYTDMMLLINKIEAADPDPTIIFVGDFVDRGDQVQEVLDWCCDNITKDGRYQSVLGNHEDMVRQFYEYWALYELGQRKWPPDGPLYLFSCETQERLLLGEVTEWYKYIRFIRSLPLTKTVTVTSKWGKTVTYRIVHSENPFGITDEEAYREKCLWDRSFESNTFDDSIIVHGHTPTIFYKDFPETSKGVFKPGLISYRKQDINVDGGCVCADVEPYPCMLCAICLETLEEIYPMTIEEKFKQFSEEGESESDIAKKAEEYRRKYIQSEDHYRLEILEMAGANNVI